MLNPNIQESKLKSQVGVNNKTSRNRKEKKALRVGKCLPRANDGNPRTRNR
jgi:hypothetical protein